MTGFESVLLRVAGTAASALVKSLLTRAPGAGLAADPARPDRPWRKPPAELGPVEVRRLTDTLAARLGPACAGLPEHERLAAVDAVGDAFAALGALGAEALFAVDLDPAALAAALPPPPAGLSGAAEALYRRLVALCCAHAVEYVTTLPGFGARADVELLRRTGELTRSVDRLREAGDGGAYAFEERYARYVCEAHGRLELFGLTFSQTRQDWPLDLAYISLAVSGEQLMPGEPGLHQSSVRAEQALGAADRVLLRGPAGSGKSTLVQWLALNAAQRTFGPALRPWDLCVPFVLRLRSFTSADSLPLPEEFLRASGVPLTAPSGWVEELMLSGRALVLVDGVDEVPQRLRTRTEAWLRSLVTAFPKARYVVTTRPSAVPDDWLAGQGFTGHSLLPMDRKDIRAFIAHWHTAARTERGPAGEDIDAYEASVQEAVGSRRDLGRLATNPLMCALLCALNRDRRMQLPRARKELYDAALDMLLVRRDTEREISGVEGVYLTRDEQILLLQRLAYWLIRNGQVQASWDEAVEMVGEWLDAMPQVKAQGGADRVFMHLLIRSGLLREPVKGSVDFVHRTFQDYLGAKAAVESRDFGVLVKNAHDDTWDDVVRMAVGHARPAERASLLRKLLARADKVRRYRNRLVLLAAACLEHAPELDPEVWREVRARTAELLPPRHPEQAEELAKAGEMVLDLLAEPAGLGEAEAAATIRTAALVGGNRALQVIAGFQRDERFDVSHELSHSWGRFPTAAYTEAVLAGASMNTAHLHIRTPEQLAALGGLPHIRRVHLSGDHGVPPEVAGRRDLEWLVIADNAGLEDLSALAGHRALRHLGVYDCPRVRRLALDGELAPESLGFGYLPDGLSLAPLAGLPGLRTLVIGFEPKERHVGDIPAAAELTELSLWQGARGLTLDGLERWQAVDTLCIAGNWQYGQLVQRRPLPGLVSLQVRHTGKVVPADLLPYRRLSRLTLVRCELGAGFGPLRELPGLTRLRLTECAGTVDLAPLAGVDRLRLELDRRTSFSGVERIPPERITYF